MDIIMVVIPVGVIILLLIAIIMRGRRQTGYRDGSRNPEGNDTFIDGGTNGGLSTHQSHHHGGSFGGHSSHGGGGGGSFGGGGHIGH